MYSKKKNYHRDIRKAGSSSRQSSMRPRVPAHKVQRGIVCQHTRCGVALCASTRGAAWHCVPAHEVRRGIACQHTRCGVVCASRASTQCAVWHVACASQRRSIVCQHTMCGIACGVCIAASEHCVPAHNVWHSMWRVRRSVGALHASTRGVAWRVHRMPAHRA
jgi:hypothetical protein